MGGCTHGRTPLNIMGIDGFEFVDYCAIVWEDTDPTLVNFNSFLSSTLSLDKFSDLFKDADKMTLVKAYLKASATSLYLGGKIDEAAGVVACIILLEDFNLATCSNGKTLKDLRNRVQYRPDEAADVMGVSVSKMKTWIRTGVLPSYTIDDMRFVMKSDLMSFIESHRNQSFGLAS